ncbi:general substrate transporter [Hortaea werneckii]|nr:general substrate transporter [Hortaea werneckii]
MLILRLFRRSSIALMILNYRNVPHRIHLALSQRTASYLGSIGLIRLSRRQNIERKRKEEKEDVEDEDESKGNEDTESLYTNRLYLSVIKNLYRSFSSIIRGYLRAERLYYTRAMHRFAFMCVLGQLVLLLAKASLLDLAGLVVVAGEAVLLSEVVDALSVELGKLLGSVDIRHLLDVALGEDQVDLLQSPTGSLRVEEVQDREEAGVEGGEEEVGTPANVLDEHWRDHDNEEVPNLGMLLVQGCGGLLWKMTYPVLSGGQSVGFRAGLERVDLSRVQPWQWQPGSTEESNVGEETDSGTLASLLSAWNERTEGDHHGKHLTDLKTQLATANALDSEPGGRGEERVHNHVNTTQEQGSVVRCVDSVLEQNREVVDHSVAARELLHTLATGTEDHTAEMLSLATSEDSRDGRVAAVVAGSADRVDDDLGVELDLLILDRLAFQSSHNFGCLLDSVFGEEPTRRLGKPGVQDNDDEGEHTLEGNREAPGERVGAVKTAIVDPATTVVGLTALGLVGWDSRCIDAVSNTSDGSSDDELGSCTSADRYCCKLDDHTNDHDDGANVDRPSSTKPVAKIQDEESAQETANRVDRDNETLVGAVALNLGEVGGESFGGDNTRLSNDTYHDTLVVTEKQEVRSSDGGNEPLQGTSAGAPEFGDTVLVHSCSTHSRSLDKSYMDTGRPCERTHDVFTPRMESERNPSKPRGPTVALISAKFSSPNFAGRRWAGDGPFEIDVLGGRGEEDGSHHQGNAMLAKKVYPLVCTDHPAQVRRSSCCAALVAAWRGRGGSAGASPPKRSSTNLASVTAWPTKLFETLFPRCDGAQRWLASLCPQRRILVSAIRSPWGG